jgi:rubredoxin
MKEIIREGHMADDIRIFRCRFCKTIFKTDEYEAKPDYRGGTIPVAICPMCNKNAYEK